MIFCQKWPNIKILSFECQTIRNLITSSARYDTL